MKPHKNSIDRRDFVKTSAIISTSLLGLSTFSPVSFASSIPAENSVFMIGPIEGYSTQIGTLVSMLNYNRYTVVSMVKSMSMNELDYLHDNHANTIGALLMHLGATEKYYQINTFEGRHDFNDEEKKKWDCHEPRRGGP